MNPELFNYYQKCKSENKSSTISYDMGINDYLSDDNYNKNTIPSYNLTYLDDEYVNIEQKNSMNQIRLIRDITTDVFTKTCITDNENVDTYDFINFLFQYTYSNLLQNLNSILSNVDDANKQYVYPLCSNEFIYLYFKGGTLMKYFKNQIYEQYEYRINNNTDPSIPDDFKKNFKISDTDMSLLIKTDSNFRFEQIKHYCIVLLSNILKNIGDIIDYLKQNIQPNNTINLSNLIKVSKYNLSKKKYNLRINKKTYYDNIDQFKGIVNSVKHRILERRDDIEYNDIQVEFNRIFSKIEILDDPINIKYSCNPVENILIVELLDFILLHKDINVQAASKATIIKFRDNCIKVNKYLNYQLLDKIKLLFSNYDNFKTELATALNNNIILNENINEVYDFDSEPSIKYLINKNMFELNPDRAATNINTLKDLLDFDSNREDYMMAHNKNVSSNRLQIKFNNPTQNYVSHNNTINLLKNNNLTLFSLIRLKHLITIKDFLIPVNNDNQPQPVLKLLNIPSELLDISIVHPYDYCNSYIYDRSYSKFKFCIPIYNHDITTVLSYIPSSNLENLIYDLQYVLFIGSMFPFHDSKYEKRIFRLLYFIKLNVHAYGYENNRIYPINYDIICKLMNTYNVTNHDNIYTLTKQDDNTGIINTIIKHFSLNIPNYNISLYKLFRINTNYIPFTEIYIVIILFSELIITNTDESKLLLYNICKHNYNLHKIINDYIINDNIDGFYADFTQKFILFIKTIKEKLNIINSHNFFRLQ